MKTFKKDSIFFKTLHVSALYAVVFQSFLPLGNAFAGSYSQPEKQNYSESLILNNNSVVLPKQVEQTAMTPPINTEKENEISDHLVNLQSLALGGPGQAESGGFSLGSTDGMVDKFTGDFSYSIPVADVEGYPIVLNYNSNIAMNSEASWVGLGWDLNVGAVSREMRGLPDEFNGEQEVLRTFHQADDDNEGSKNGGYIKAGYSFFDNPELMPAVQLTALWGKYKNTYLGRGKTFDFGLQASASYSTAEGIFLAPSFGVGYSSDSKRGVGKNHSFGLSAGLDGGIGSGATRTLGITFGNSFNSRQGLTERTIGVSGDIGRNGNNSSFSAGYGATSVIPYGTLTSVPSIKMNSIGSTFSSGIDLYAGVKTGNLVVKIGYLHKENTTLSKVTTNGNNQLVQPAIGYFHNGKYEQYERQASEYSSVIPLMDFNRTNDEEYSEAMKNLAFSIQTYDVFRSNAMGLGATFRGRRSDVGTYRDPNNKSVSSIDGSEGVIGAVVTMPGVTVELGVSGVNAEGVISSGNYVGTDGTNVVEFVQEAKSTNFDGSVYFKGVGEMTPENQTDLGLLGGAAASYLSLQLASNQKDVQLTGKYVTPGSLPVTVNKTAINSTESPIRAMDYRPYTASQYVAIETNYNSLTGFSTGITTTVIKREQSTNANGARYSNHLSAVEVVNTDGIRYVFGVPAYELISSQVSFGATGKTDPDFDGVYVFDNGDNTENNTKGVSDYFDKTTVPAYPHSFLLTEMVSSDYIDRSNDGPSLDDVGNYYKFNYTRLYNETNSYKWRFPLGQNSAFLSRGLLGSTRDDIGSYSYGEKEIWYTHSVESKNLIAEFYLSDRDDAYGVVGESGQMDYSKPLKKLDKIVIYNRSERLGANGANAQPLQIVEFEYSYELCKNFPANYNSNLSNAGADPSKSGKLTLKKIRSYSGGSEEMGLYTYEFNYDASINKDFSYSTDAWGNYKAIDALKPSDVYPYAEQDATTANNVAKNWKLVQVITPTNGTLDIEYAADSYATVQDKRVMKHMDVVGMTNVYDMLDIQSNSTWNITGASTIYSTFSKEFPLVALTYPDYVIMNDYINQFAKLDRKYVPNNIIVFKLDEGIGNLLTPQQASDELRTKWFSDPNQANELLRELYFKLHTKVRTGRNETEMVPVFGEISPDLANLDAIGVMPKSSGSSNYEYGYAILKPAKVDDKDGDKKGFAMSSLQKSALEFIRRNLPDIVYGASPNSEGDMILDQAVALGGADINRIMAKSGWIPSIVVNSSPLAYTTSVRLYVPNNIKFGGNARVKTLKYKDNWLAISEENIPGEYTWVYEYPEFRSTSGNAAFEPQGMLDECALYEWDTYVNLVEKFPDETKFTPTPIMSILYPAPVIGYEKVKVSISGTTNKGFSISEFHTSRTHPVYANATPIDKSVSTDKPSSVIAGRTTQRFGFAQGFFIHTNDFHGKPNQSKVIAFDENNNEIVHARTTYIYADLDEQQRMIARDGIVSNQTIAQECDIHADSRFIENKFNYSELGVSLKIVFKPGFIFPYLLPSFSQQSRVEAFYSNALVKHINTSAIVTAIETEQLGSINTAENLLYDYHTGNVLLSSLNDEYGDPLYSLNYPAHWYYTEMRDLSSSQGSTVTTTINGGGLIQNMDQVFTPGDFVRIMNLPSQPTAWIGKKNTTTNGDLFLMDANGLASSIVSATGSYQVKIEKSNRDNRLNETMQSMVTKIKLLNGLTFDWPTIATPIWEASTLTYRDRNNLKCGIPNAKEGVNNNEVAVNTTINPYLFGVRGDLVADGQFSWQSERRNAKHDYKTRFDGVYSSFVPFYQLTTFAGGGRWKMINETSHPNHIALDKYQKWRKMGEVTTFDQYANPIESRDQLNIFSAVQYGYDRTFNLVPIAQAVNARQQDIAFDGFEDYAYYAAQSATITNNVPHFDFKASISSPNVTLDNVKRHSGLSSIKVRNGGTATFSTNVGVGCLASTALDPGDNNRFTVQECHCIQPFEPTPGKYVVGAWLTVSNPTVDAEGIIVINIGGTSPSTTYLTATGPVIDGWQRLEGTFTIPPTGATSLVVQLITQDGAEVNFDDIRIHPLLAGMTTTVYDPKTLLPLASHDGYNFTTFYNYDENLNLVRVRVETIDGIKTVSESEMGGFKKPKQ
ncbi:MAG: hypothetical protein QE487_00780 [Fluviicola sp.]|nr:hypothetical protein [Fluviicola sp.]